MTEFPSAQIEVYKAARARGAHEGLHVAIEVDDTNRVGGSHAPCATEPQRGAAALRRTIGSAAAIGVTHLTLFGPSREDGTRSASDVPPMAALVRDYLQRHATELDESGFRFSAIGTREDLPSDVTALIADAERRTQPNPNLHVTVALHYGGRPDIVAAARRLAVLVQAGTISPRDIDEGRFGANLSTWFLPDPDLVIRTGGGQRLGNFLLWQLAYAEMVFVDKPWADFTGEDLAAAILEFRRRDRRFGAIVPNALAGAAIQP